MGNTKIAFDWEIDRIINSSCQKTARDMFRVVFCWGGVQCLLLPVNMELGSAHGQRVLIALASYESVIATHIHVFLIPVTCSLDIVVFLKYFVILS